MSEKDTLPEGAPCGDSILDLISESGFLVIEACDGTETLAGAGGAFPAGIDARFKKWGTDKPAQATAETPVSVYQMIGDATFEKAFGCLWKNLDSACLTQRQIIEFCRKHPGWLRNDGYGTFFLFKSEGQYFVANVFVYRGALRVYAHRFEENSTWFAERARHIVVPQGAS